MDSNENQQEYKTTLYLENKIKELHLNIRHITQLAMNWFAFLVTINYFTLGWLAKGQVSDRPDSHIIWVVAIVFIVQNLLGMSGIYMVARKSCEKAKQIRTYEDLVINLSDAREKDKKDLIVSSVTTDLYKYIAGALIVVLFSLAVAWTLIGIHYSNSN